MKGGKLSNISLSDIRTFLQKTGCQCKGVTGGHEKWTKEGLSRPIIIQTHIDPVPEFIVKNILRDLELTRHDFFEIFFDVR